MRPTRARFIICVAMALAAHAALLGWSGAQDAVDASALLRATRSTDASVPPSDPSGTLAARDQRGDDERSRQARLGGRSDVTAALSEAGRAATLTRFVMVARRPSETRTADQQRQGNPGDDGARTQSQQAMDASRDRRAAYLSRWQDEIEARGSRQYPSALLEDSPSRRLTMAVRLAPDGRLRAVRVLRSSGNAALDDAAVRIVRDAAPFAAFDTPPGAPAEDLSFAYDWLFKASGDARLKPAG